MNYDSAIKDRTTEDRNSSHIQEYIKCRRDPIYFLKNYAKIRHPIRGLISFELWDFQEDCVNEFLEFPYNIILKARQLGISTLCAGYAAWMMTFFRDKEIYIVATKGKVATNLVSKIKVILKNLPDELRPYDRKPPVDNRQSIELANGSKVQATGTTEDVGRSESLSLLIIDEAAFVRNMDNIWTAAQPTLSTGGDCIVLSTPNGIGNWFHKTYNDAENGLQLNLGENIIGFHAKKLHWSMHPDRNDTWAEHTRAKIGKRRFAQEHDADFLQSGNTVIDIEDLQWFAQNPRVQDGYDIAECPYLREPLEKIGFDKGLWVWKYPQPGKRYIIPADIARGDGGDFSAAQVIEEESYEQVAEYKGKIPTDIFGQLLVQLAVQYNNALLVPENASIGWATIQKILDLNYANLYWTDKTRLFVDVTKTQDIVDPWDKSKKNLVPGFTTSGKTRPLIIEKFEEDLRNHDFIIHSKRLFDECLTFVYLQHGNTVRANHQDGYNDDLIISAAIGMYVRSINQRMYNAGRDMQNQIVNNMSFVSNEYQYGILQSEKNKVPNYFKQSTARGAEDLTWLV